MVREITGVGLVASAEGDPLYRQAGFAPGPFGTPLIRIERRGVRDIS